MQSQAAGLAAGTIHFIESHLDSRLELETAASSLHYSKFHLHRTFTRTVGLTVHEYARRRQLTEAARLLVFSKKPIIEIALLGGYESQQAFTDIFKAMYKVTPAAFRKAKTFYPLQTEIRLNHFHPPHAQTMFTQDDVSFAAHSDTEDWMELVNQAIDGSPCLDEQSYRRNLHRYIDEKRALVLRDGSALVGAMGISYESCRIDFLAIHPQYRRSGVARSLLDRLTRDLFCGKEISITTFRAGDKADTGHRHELLRLGFEERELLTEYGYPTQKFVLPPRSLEETHYDEINR